MGAPPVAAEVRAAAQARILRALRASACCSEAHCTELEATAQVNFLLVQWRGWFSGRADSTGNSKDFVCRQWRQDVLLPVLARQCTWESWLLQFEVQRLCHLYSLEQTFLEMKAEMRVDQRLQLPATAAELLT